MSIMHDRKGDMVLTTAGAKPYRPSSDCRGRRAVQRKEFSVRKYCRAGFVCLIAEISPSKGDTLTA